MAMDINLDKKEGEIKQRFSDIKEDAMNIEIEIKRLQNIHNERMAEMTRLQGAMSLIKELRGTEEKEPEQAKGPE